MDFYRYWGKARKDDLGGSQQPAYHLLPYHCLDVAAVAESWWDNSANMRRCFCQQTGLGEVETKAWLLFFVALHDFGKYDPRFQKKADTVWRQIDPESERREYRFSATNISGYYHGPGGLYWFYQDWKARFTAETSDSFYQEENEDWQSWCSWLAPVTGHHGSIPTNEERDSNDFNLTCLGESVISKFRTARQQWLTALESLFLSPAGLSLSDNPPLLKTSTLLAGFCSVADWLGSCADQGAFEYDDQPVDNLAQWYVKRLPIAEKQLKRSGITGLQVNGWPSIAKLLQKGHKPKQVQCLIDQLPQHQSLSIIEASTGSGKTEAALAYAWRLLDQGLADSIVFALPTQATANAMFQRLEKAATVIFQGGINAVLAHGRAKLQKDFINLKQATAEQTFQDKEEAWVQCAQWLAESRKRVFLGQVGICTVDQMLVSVLPIQHKFVRGFGVGRSVLIVDEVHAYDAYMYGLLEAVLRQQKVIGGSAILLSATLPHHQKQQLLSAWSGEQVGLEGIKPECAPYPLITHLGTQCQQLPLDDPARQPPDTHVNIELRPVSDLLPDDALLERMVQAAEQGAQVCLICNLVDVAQQTLERLKGLAQERLKGEQLILFHARFVYKDREDKEKKVLELFGPGSERTQGHILVSTQVFECSIDADMDWMISQLCPVDLLFQRWGRLHRHPKERQRPAGFEQPCCTVLVPEGSDYGNHKFIYGDSRILWRTQQLLEQAKGVVSFPQAYREWIERVYQEENWGSEPEGVLKSHDDFIEEQYAQRMTARQLVEGTVKDQKDKESNIAALTRDGEMTLTLIPVLTNEHGQECLLNGRVMDSLDDSNRYEQFNLNSLGVPANWNKKKSKGQLPDMNDKGQILLPMAKDGKDFQGQWDKTQYRYSSETGFIRIKET